MIHTASTKKTLHSLNNGMYIVEVNMRFHFTNQSDELVAIQGLINEGKAEQGEEDYYEM
jgi:hypothetical protein